MRIAINTRFLLKGRLEGIGVFTKEVVKRMVLSHPEVEFYFFFDRAYDSSYLFADNVVPVVVNPPARHPVLWYLWFEWAVPYYLKKHKIDYFFSPDSYLSLRSKVPQTVVIHDLAFEHYPEGVGGLVSSFYSYYLPKYAKKAQRIVTVSEFTKQDIVDKYDIEAGKIDVAFNAADSKFQVSTVEEKKSVKKEYTNGADYFLYVGALHPRKNVSHLLEAFDRFKSETDSDTKLLLVGREAWGNQEMEGVYNSMKFKHEVIFTGRVSDEVLVNVYGAALALVYVPFFEGFGIPIVEAQACQVPVITSNCSSMPEVLGKAGVLVDPFSVESICDGLQLLDSDVSLREQLVEKGNKNLERFDWQISADKIFELITQKEQL